jgi:xylono-1,5-lactonase
MNACIADYQSKLGEGPVWVAREEALYWVDIIGGRLMRWSQAEGPRNIPIRQPLCSIVPRESGGFIGGSPHGFVAISDDFVITPIADPEPHLPGNRMNDGKVDRAGRFWAGTMDAAERSSTGSLYRLDADLSWTMADSGYGVTNGPAFSPDGRTMYHSDSAAQRIYAFDLAEDGSVSNRRTFAQFGDGEGYPDGMTVDVEGCLWVAFWDGWCLRRLSPSGERMAELGVSVQRPTSCTFGGKDLDLMFVTSARRDFSAEELRAQPEAGGLFVMYPGVTGIPERLFAG